LHSSGCNPENGTQKGTPTARAVESRVWLISLVDLRAKLCKLKPSVFRVRPRKFQTSNLDIKSGIYIFYKSAQKLGIFVDSHNPVLHTCT
jgi:ribosomal protein L19E